jgi:class 3 adenylate cyclase
MTAARRLAAIMAVDVVGYSRLMGEDEAGTARAVRERPIVARLGGRIVMKLRRPGVRIEDEQGEPGIVLSTERSCLEGPDGE